MHSPFGHPLFWISFPRKLDWGLRAKCLRRRRQQATRLLAPPSCSRRGQSQRLWNWPWSFSGQRRVFEWRFEGLVRKVCWSREWAYDFGSSQRMLEVCGDPDIRMIFYAQNDWMICRSHQPTLRATALLTSPRSEWPTMLPLSPRSPFNFFFLFQSLNSPKSMFVLILFPDCVMRGELNSNPFLLFVICYWWFRSYHPSKERVRCIFFRSVHWLWSNPGFRSDWPISVGSHGNRSASRFQIFGIGNN